MPPWHRCIDLLQVFPYTLRERLVILPFCSCYVDDCSFSAVELFLWESTYLYSSLYCLLYVSPQFFIGPRIQWARSMSAEKCIVPAKMPIKSPTFTGIIEYADSSLLSPG